MKIFKKITDERQEQEFLKIERVGFWLLFWGLVIATMIENFIFDYSFPHIAGEFIVLVTTAVIVLILCVKKGLWSRYVDYSFKSNLLMSLGTAFVFAAISTAYRYYDLLPEKKVTLITMVAIFVVFFFMLFFLCFGGLTIFGALTDKRKKKLEVQWEDDE